MELTDSIEVLRQVLAKVEQVAQTTATVLLRGETGTRIVR